jgi:transposase
LRASPEEVTQSPTDCKIGVYRTDLVCFCQFKLLGTRLIRTAFTWSRTCGCSSDTCMAYMTKISLNEEERSALKRAIRETGDLHEWRRLRAVLLLADGYSGADVAYLLDTTRQTIYGWMGRYNNARTPEVLRARPRPGRARSLSDTVCAILKELLDRTTASTPAWSVPRLCAHLRDHYEVAASGITVRRALRTLGYRWSGDRFERDEGVATERPVKKVADRGHKLNVGNEKQRPTETRKHNAGSKRASGAPDHALMIRLRRLYEEGL